MAFGGLNGRQRGQIILAGLLWSAGFCVVWFDLGDMRPFGLLVLLGAGALVIPAERRRWTRPVELKMPTVLTFLLVMFVLVLVALFLFFSRDPRLATFWNLLEPIYPWLGLALYVFLLPSLLKRWRDQMLAGDETEVKTDLANAAD